MTVTEHGAAGSGPGSILVVCTGNVCRSPYIERRLRQVLAGSGISVVSAGTEALVGYPMDRTSAALLDAMGAPWQDFVARQLTPGLIAEADLVLAAARQHRGAAARMHPPALRTAVTVTDLADLLSGVTVADVRAQNARGSWVSQTLAMARSRRAVVPARQSGVDITDPIGRSRAVFGQMADEIESALRVIGPVLSGAAMS